MSVVAIKHSNCPTCRCSEQSSSLDETQVESPKPHTFGSAREMTPEEREFRDKAFKELRMEFDKESKISQLQSTNQQLVEALTQILGWRELRDDSGFPVERIEEIARQAITNAKQQGDKND
jgi:hypothetical protein